MSFRRFTRYHSDETTSPRDRWISRSLSMKFDSLRSIWRNVATPKVSEDRLEKCLAYARKEIRPPVCWLLGKAQSGKTSIVRALTGAERAEIGAGFAPCTRTASLYAFPTSGAPLVQFLDTRGLGEVSYDPSEDLAKFPDLAHLLIVTVKANDHALAPIAQALAAIQKSRPDWPILVAQTNLHELYPERGSPHRAPYPFSTNGVPSEEFAREYPSLASSLAKQRETLSSRFRAKSTVPFVPIDFTLPEDGFEPREFGLEALWTAIEEIFPRGLRAMMAQDESLRGAFRDAHFAKAHPQILWHSLAAGLAASIPVPLVDMPLVLGIQTKMFQAICSVYNQEFNARRLAEIFGGLGLAFAGRLGLREALKAIPGYGSAATAAYAAATTYAMGRTLCVYFGDLRDGDLPDSSRLRELYRQQFEEGRRALAEYLKGKTLE